MRSAAEALRGGEEVALFAHVSPDGDTLGSALALRLALLQLGKRVTVYCEDQVPPLYHIMPGWESVKPPDGAVPSPIAVSVDVSDFQRLGRCGDLFCGAQTRVVIDHHITNPGFGTIDCIRECAATGQLILQLTHELGAALTPEIALCLYIAISTDTGNFSHTNTTGDALRAAAELVDAGADVVFATKKIYRERSFAKAKLIGAALSRLTLEEEGRLAMMVLLPEDYRQSGATDADTEGLINYAIECVGVEVAVLARETEQGVKVSLRSAPRGVDVSALTASLGGGGHKSAAGVTLRGPLDAAVEAIRSAAQKALRA